jgi:uncharacterized protein YkwD
MKQELKEILITGMMLTALAVLLLGGCCTCCHAQQPISLTEQGIVDAVNKERARAGLNSVAIDNGLMQGCRKHAQWMSSRGKLQHTNNVNEVIAWGQENPERAVEDWMGSHVGHKDVLLGKAYTKIGAAMSVRRGRRAYWICQFK